MELHYLLHQFNLHLTLSTDLVVARVNRMCFLAYLLYLSKSVAITNVEFSRDDNFNVSALFP
jgi:hypothetical protein